MTDINSSNPPVGSDNTDSQTQDSGTQDTASTQDKGHDYEKRFKDTQAKLTETSQQNSELKRSNEAMQSQIDELKSRLDDKEAGKRYEDADDPAKKTEILADNVSKKILNDPSIKAVEENVKKVERFNVIEEAKMDNPDFQELVNSGHLNEELKRAGMSLSTFSGDKTALNFFIGSARMRMENDKLKKESEAQQKLDNDKQRLSNGHFNGAPPPDPDAKMVKTELGEMDEYSARFVNRRSKFQVG